MKLNLKCRLLIIEARFGLVSPFLLQQRVTSKTLYFLPLVCSFASSNPSKSKSLEPRNSDTFIGSSFISEDQQTLYFNDMLRNQLWGNRSKPFHSAVQPALPL